MDKKFLTRSGFTYALCVIWTLVAGSFSLAGAENTSPSILFVTWEAEPGVMRPWKQDLIDAGYQVKAVQRFQEVNWDMLKQFNVVVMTPPLGYEPTAEKPASYSMNQAELKTWVELLKRYLAQGGGAFVYGNCSSTTQPPAVEAMLKSYGANILFEQVIDEKQAYLQPDKVKWTYFWTSSVVRSPLTEGVKTIFCPNNWFMYGPTTSPLEVTADWQILVKGSAAARSLAATYIGTTHWPTFVKENPGTYKTEPPLMAVKQVGNGRLGISGISPYTSFIWTKHPAYEDISLSRGSGETPSDLGRLLLNVYRWLAEPSLSSGVLGGFVMPVEEKKPYAGGAVRSGTDWSGVRISYAPRSFAGVIGARTVLTGEEGTVADWVKAAKIARLQWMVFAEDFTKLTPESWEKFRKECAAASGDNFTAVPGWDIWDVGDNRWVQFGLNLTWPAAAILDKDGKRIRDCQEALFDTGGSVLAPINIKENAHPSWNYRDYNGFAIVTQNKDKILDDSLKEYLYQQGIGDYPQPLAVNLMKAPAELAYKDIYRVYVCSGKIEELRRYLTVNSAAYPKTFISTGPKILCWNGFGLARASANWYDPGTERWQVRLAVASGVDLKEVIIYDKTNIYARYLPKGKRFNLILDGLHDQQRYFTAVVTDVKGGRVITDGLLTFDMLNWHFMCSDRLNTINGAQQLDPITGRMIWWRPGSYQTKGRGLGLSPALPEDPWIQGPPGLDGGLFPGSIFSIGAQVQGEPRPDAYPFPQGFSPLASKHIQIQEWKVEQEYVPIEGVHVLSMYGVLCGTPYLSFRPLEDCTYEIREVALVMQPHELPILVVETKVYFKKDVTVRQNPWCDIGIILGTLMNSTVKVGGENDHYVLHLNGVETIEGDVSKPFNWSGAFPAGSYFGNYPGMLANSAILAIDDGYQFHVQEQPGQTLGIIGAGKAGQKFTAGTEKQYRFLTMLTSLNGPPKLEQVAWVSKSMGIAGPPAYSVKVSQGKVLGTKVFLDIEAEDGGFVGMISKAKLPVRLPIRIYRLNPNWSAAVYNRERKELLPFGFADGVGYASIDTQQNESDVYIGNLVTCDVAELRIWVVEESDNKIKVTVHNPTDEKITATVKSGRGYNRVPAFSRQVIVQGGHSINLIVAGEEIKEEFQHNN